MKKSKSRNKSRRFDNDEFVETEQLTEQVEKLRLIPEMMMSQSASIPPPSLSDMLSSDVLNKGKKGLKSVTKKKEVKIEREGVIASASKHGSLPLARALDFMKSQTMLADVTVLELSGTEQLTDIFLYLLWRKNIEFKMISRISLVGCVHLTDTGITWLTKAFKDIEYVELHGCSKLTEKSLWMMNQRWENSLKQINMQGTRLGLIPQGCGIGIKVGGCPLLSPPEKIYKDISSSKKDVPYYSGQSYKMVILTDALLPWSPMALINGEKNIKNEHQFKVQKLSDKLHAENRYSIFEMPLKSGFCEMVLGEGSIVVVPYVIHGTDMDFDYVDEIGTSLSKLIAKHPQCVFVLMGMSEDPGLLETAGRYGNLILGKLTTKNKNMSKEIQSQFESNQKLATVNYVHQEIMRTGLEMSEQLDTVKSSAGLFLKTYVCVGKNPINSIKEMTKTATEILLQRYPWLFLKYHEDLKNTLEEISRINVDLTSIQMINEMTTSETSFLRVKYSNSTNKLVFTRKVFSVMHAMGRALYYPALEESPVITNFNFLATVYNGIIANKGPRKASWRYLGQVNCWTQGDMEKLGPDKSLVPLLIKLLEHHGLLYKLPRDCWTTELQDTFAYVTPNSLPYYPTAIDTEELWEDNLAEQDSEAGRYFYFQPEVTHTFFPSILRKCVSLGSVKLLWKTGVIIRKGAVTILLEMMKNHEEQTVLFLGVRLLHGKSKNFDSSFVLMQWTTFDLYRTAVFKTLLEQKLYAIEYIPCPYCVPSKNRNKTVNSAQVNMIPERLVQAKNRTQRDLVCQNDGNNIKTKPLLGPILLEMKDTIPSHYFLGCLPSFSSSNRCMLCESCAANGPTCPGNLKHGKSAWNCSCDTEGQMCDECGVCQRCINLMCELYTTKTPSFLADGSTVSLNSPESPYELPHELSPNYVPRLEVHLVRGAHINLQFKLGNTLLVYDTKEGSITEYDQSCGTKQNSEWVTREGFTISVKLRFCQEDFDDMEVVFYLQGHPFHIYKCSSQSCKVIVKAHTSSSLVIHLPNLKLLWPQGVNDFGEKQYCNNYEYSLLPCTIEAKVVKMKDAIGDALFQAGGINYSGAAMVVLPHQIDMASLQIPTFDKFKFLERPVNQLLCYTRSKISDVLVQGNMAAPESWSVYRMIHLVDSAGFRLKADAQQDLEMKCYFLLWMWHFLFKLQPQIDLPANSKNLLQVSDEDMQGENLAKVQAGLHDIINLGHWRLLVGLDLTTILLDLADPELLMGQAEAIKSVVQWNEDKTGLKKTVSHFNEESFIYLCPGHHASMRIEEGLTEVLPEIYGDYAKFLLSVDIPANQLTELPEEMFKFLPNLTEFDCSRNFISQLPSSISHCRKLYSLAVPENNLTDLPETLKDCKELWRLDITSNMMEVIPAVVCKLTQLKKLYAAGMFLTSLPGDIGNLVNLEKLSLNGNCLTSLPKSFGRLRSLTDLGLSGVPWYGNIKAGKTMKFDEFQKRLVAWGLDRWLTANNVDGKKFFDSFDVDNNEYLDANELSKMNSALFNMFPRFGYKGTQPPDADTSSGFPMEITECRNLEYLSFFYQGLVSVPAEIGNLQELRILNLSHNPNLLSIPAELSTISSLIRIDMAECPILKTPPREIRAKGFATIFGYLRRMMSGSQQCKRTKLMLVGLGGAGKTSLVNSLLSKDGKSNLTQGEAITDGIDITNWTVKHGDESVTYSVWDFAGQTVYYNTHQFFLSNRAVYLLLWNVRLGHEHAGLDFWLSSISVQAPHAPIFVVGSHVDQVSKYELPMNEMKERYKQIAGFHFVSSYTGQGIKDLQNQLYEVTLQEKYMGEQIPEVWLTLENSVVSCRSSSDVIEYTELEQMANTSGLFEKTEIYQAVQFLHELGSLQHFTTESLKSKVVVNPQWIVDVMACVVSVKNSPINEGRLNHKDIARIWEAYPKELHDWLLHLTEAYDLTFPLDSKPVNLVPCLLPEKVPEYSLPDVEKDSLIKRNKMIYKFDYLPAGLFNRAQVRLHQLSDSAHIWKRGSFLNKNGHVALINQTRDSELNVTVQGPRPENVLFLIHEVFEGLISESFAGVKYDFQIPCPDCLRLVIKEPHMFAASTIRRALELKAPFLQCVKYFHTISCIDLLACMPPDNHSDFDLHLVQSVRSLRDLRKDLSADVFMSYCQKNAPKDRNSVIHPATVCQDLVNIGYKCWFAEKGKKFTIDEMARALTDASVFVVFISKEYVQDEECVNTFKYARLALRKPMVVIACGEGYEWKQSKLGILLSDEVYVNMANSKKEMYRAKFDELVAALGNKTNIGVGRSLSPSCFFSYSWVNSIRAVELGTRSVTRAIGHGDPRQLKEYLDSQGVKCWIDIERVGQNGLFDDIAEGLLNAKVVIVCVSDEYAESSTCMMEFRYAVNVLKLPIIIAVVGMGNRWRSMEVGMLSLNFPIVSFQEKSDTAFVRLLELVKEQLDSTLSEKDQKNESNEKSKNLSFQELFELVQRKLLRQLSSYAEQHDVGVYPRVFAIDFMKKDEEGTEDQEKEEKKKEVDNDNGDEGEREKKLVKKPLLKRMGSMLHVKSLFRLKRYSVHVLCEHDEGWHSISEPLTLKADFGETMLDKFCPYIARISAVMKYNRQLQLHYITDEVGQEFVKWQEESPLAALSDYQDIYRELREVVMAADSQKIMGKLDRCRLPNGRTMWLCEQHQKNMKVTVLGKEESAIHVDFDAAETIELKMIDALRSGNYIEYKDRFVSSKTAVRKPDGTQSTKPNMYVENYELLPDKKRPMPSKIASKRAEPKDETKKIDLNLQINDNKEQKLETKTNNEEFKSESDVIDPLKTGAEKSSNVASPIKTASPGKKMADSSLIKSQTSDSKAGGDMTPVRSKTAVDFRTKGAKADVKKTPSSSLSLQQQEEGGKQKSKACSIM